MKDRYTTDKTNRLVIKRGRKTLVPNGNFAVEKNKLVYWLNEPAGWRREHSVAPKISFAGKWRLGRDHNLELLLGKTEIGRGYDCLALKGEIISASADELAFRVESIGRDGSSHVRVLKLSGLWEADSANRIIFNVAKSGSPERLLFSGAWQVNENQQITYECERAGLKKGPRVLNTVTFCGFWEINSRNRLTYVISHGTGSRFDFRAQLESPSLYPGQGAIKYRIGIGLKGRASYLERTLCLYGAWKFGRKAGLSYEIDYGGGVVKSLRFGADVYFSKKDKAEFSLLNSDNEPLGISVILTHRFLESQDAQFFLKLKGSRSASGIEAGVRIPF